MRFKKQIAVLFSVLVLGLVAFSIARNDFDGINPWGTEKSTRLMMGYDDTRFLDASSANATAPSTFINCRAISVDSTGLVKIAYQNDYGDTITEVKMLNAGLLYPIRNIVVLYRYYTGTTAGTAQSYKSDGTVVINAIKIHR